MLNERQNNLKEALLLTTGIILGAATVIFYKENKTVNAGKALNQVRQIFKAQGPIEGSWIDYEPVAYEAYESKPLVYIGGISRIENNKVVTYQFACDIYTGDILDTFIVSTDDKKSQLY